MTSSSRMDHGGTPDQVNETDNYCSESGEIP